MLQHSQKSDGPISDDCIEMREEPRAQPSNGKGLVIEEAPTQKMDKEIRSLCYHHLKLTSIRGIRRFMDSNVIFLKLLWLLYIIGMLCFLITSSFLLINNYLNYTTLDRMEIEYNMPMIFPEVTVCYKQPFSFCAMKVWYHWPNISGLSLDDFDECRGYLSEIQKLKIRQKYLERNMFVSPLQLGQLFRKKAITSIDNGNISESKAWLESDTMENYLANSAFTLLNQTFVSNFHFTCRLSDDLSDKTKCINERFFHPIHPSCFTFKLQKTVPISSTSKMIISLQRRIPFQENVNKWFVSDNLKQEGAYCDGELLVSLHQKSSFPSIQYRAKSLLENRSYTFEFQQIVYQRVSTKKEPCHSKKSFIWQRTRPYKSVERKDCVLSHLQKKIINRCNCYSKNLPIFHEKEIHKNITETYSSCNRLQTDNGEQFLKYQKCLRDSLKNEKLWQDSKVGCVPSCNKTFFKFRFEVVSEDNELSQMRWKSHLDSQYQKLNSGNCTLNKKQTLQCKKVKRQIKDYISNGPIPDFNQSWSTTVLIMRAESHHIRRKSLVLLTSVQNAISQFGGLCTLALGLTPMIVIEFVEFLYKACQTYFNNRRNSGT